MLRDSFVIRMKPQRSHDRSEAEWLFASSLSGYAVVLIDPTQPILPTAACIAGLLVDYPFDSTRATVQLVWNGVVDWHPSRWTPVGAR
jgi:hypothetical protein